VSPLLILITDPAFEDARITTAAEAAARALAPGAFAVQLREKTDPARRARLARLLRGLTRAHGQLLVVNSDLELAREVGADGVHLPAGAPAVAVARAAMPSAWVSVAAHDAEEVRRARDADAALLSPIFDTAGKGPPRGIGAIRAARGIAPALAIYALGGVDAGNAAACRAAGAAGVAVVRAILAAPDAAAAALALTAS
jgi:thiamine-phosphate pyrophosphorylase